MRITSSSAALLLCFGSSLLVTACGGGTVLRAAPRLGNATVLATSADVRLVTSTPARGDTWEVVKPKQIICAEPSPDVAKIVSEAFGSSGALGFRGKGPNIPANADVNTTLALSKSYAEGVAQMTERLATIQLLRDGLYRACEAYSNGAISATTYAALVSRYDKTMVTLLMGELAAGSFGRSLAGLSGTAQAKSAAELIVSELHDRQDDLKRDLASKETRKQQLKDQLNALPPGEATAAQEARLREDLTETSRDVTDSKTELRKVQDKLDQTLKASSKSQSGTTVSAAGDIKKYGTEAASAIAANLVQIQANYLNDHNVDAIKIACLSSMGKADTERPQPHLVDFCRTLVQTLTDNERTIMRAQIANGIIPGSAFRELFVPAAHAYGPFFQGVPEAGNGAPPPVDGARVMPVAPAPSPTPVHGDGMN